MSASTVSSRHTNLAAAEHVRCRRFDEDLVMVDLEGGEYFALDAVGGRMWDLLVSGKTPAEVGAILAAEYEASEDEIFRDCMKLADDLLQRRLLVVRLP
jgi:Coenzyme PQQ synthesis protein D (PqqD)